MDITQAPRQDYNAARPSRFRAPLVGVAPMGSHADYHFKTESDYLRIMEWARNIDRNDQVVGQGIDRLVANVLQDGLLVEPDTGNKEFDTYLREKFHEEWGSDPQQCHLGGELTLLDMAAMNLRAMVVDGDMIDLPTTKGSLQPIEAHRVRTPRGTTKNVVHGVLLDEDRRRIQYWVTKEDVDPMRPLHLVKDVEPINTYNNGLRQVFHVLNPKRISQTRGISALAPIMDTVGMHDDIQFANLVKQQVASCIAFLRERGPDFEGGAPGDYIEEESQSLSNGTTRTIHGFAPGMEITGARGEMLKAFSPNIPNAEFFPHAKMILQFIAINLGLPLQVLLLDASQTNFSGWRGAVDQARLGMKSLQRVMRDRFYRPVYLWKVRDWIATDPKVRAWANEAGPRVLKHSWGLPTWPYIEPFKDAQADALVIDEGLNSRREVLGKRGIRVEDVDRDQVQDRKSFILLALKAAQDINKEFPDAGVNWRDFDQGGRIKAAIMAQPQEVPEAEIKEAEGDEQRAA